MKKRRRPEIRMLTGLGIPIAAVLLERSVQKAYLATDIYESYQSHGLFYLIISIAITSIIWRVETKKQPSSTLVKTIALLVIFAACLFLANRIELWINSKTQKGVTAKDYVVQQEEVSKGKIGIRDLQSGEIDRITVKADDLTNLLEHDTIRVEFKEGMLGFKHSPVIQK